MILTDEQYAYCKRSIDLGVPSHVIAKRLGLSNMKQKAVFYALLNTMKFNKNVTSLGSKQEAYWSEKEALKPLVYTWDSLSKNEQSFYEELIEKRIETKSILDEAIIRSLRMR
jgi:hypothetical protein